jgi:hypothetical protein
MTEPEFAARSFDAALALLDKPVKWMGTQRSPSYTGEITGVGAVIEIVLGPIERDVGNSASKRWTSSLESTGRQRSGATRSARA